MNRIEKIQAAHPWLTDDETVAIILVAFYKRFTDAGVRGKMLDYMMDDTTESLCKKSCEEDCNYC